jgi:hypothetical protein
VTATHIGESARDKFFRYALRPADGKPFLWDPAPSAKRISSPWISDNVGAPITTMQGAIPPSMNVQYDFAKQIRKALAHYGIANEPLGIDMMEIGTLRALDRRGHGVCAGNLEGFGRRIRRRAHRGRGRRHEGRLRDHHQLPLEPPHFLRAAWLRSVLTAESAMVREGPPNEAPAGCR